MITKTLPPATDKQLAFARKLLEEKDWSDFGEDTLSDALTVQAGGSIAKKYASGLIDVLLARPKKPVAVTTNTGGTVALTEGVYIAPDGSVIKLKKSKAGNLYAQVLVAKASGTRINLRDQIVPAFAWVYTPGLQKHLTPDMLLTKEQAADFGIKTSRCIWCGRKLVASESVIKSIGPVCIKRFS